MSNVRRILLPLGAILLLAISVLVVLIAVALGNALLIQESNLEINVTSLDSSLVEEHLDLFARIYADSLKFKTISTDVANYDREELSNLLDFLQISFPLTYNTSFIDVKTINSYSLLFTVQGTNPDLKPYMLTGHLDVVPVVAEKWMEDPFLGEVITDPISGEKVIWGRGAIDDKAAVISILASLELLLMTGWTPKRTFYIGFGHDEEVGGFDGAAHIAAHLHKQDVKLDFLLDEGLPISIGVMPGMSGPVALIGVTEKGSVTLRVEAEGTGGHSSIPTHDQAVSSLATAIHNLYLNPQPSMFGRGPEEETLKSLAPKAEWPYKFVFANTWLFRPLLPYGMSKSRESNAIIRTTTAVTMVRGGIKENVIPASAWALVNHRVHPAQSTEEVIQHDIDSIANPDIKLTIQNSREPHPTSPYGPESMQYTLLTSVLKNIYPDVVSAPGLMIANTDTIHYLNLTSNIYRFDPFIVTKEGIKGFHGKNEMLSKSKFSDVIRFFSSLILESEDIFDHWSSRNARKKREL